jgi:pSer/pThr/pTyr-binding forkhead associated (FHA) protein
VTNGDQTQLVPTSAEAASHTYVNGVKLSSTDPVSLKPNDRIIFGTGTVLLYRCQKRDSEATMTDDPANPITYEFAMTEKGKIENQEEEARREREKAEQEAAAAEKMAALKAEMDAEKA